MLIPIPSVRHLALFLLCSLFVFSLWAPAIQAQTTGGDLEGPDYVQPPKHFKTLMHAMAEAGLVPPPENPPPVPVYGTREVLVILVELTDAVHDPAHTTNYFYHRFFDTTPPSVRNFYTEVSYDNFTYVPGDVLGWYSVPFTTTEWNDDRRPIVTAAIQAADADFDFSVYDTDPVDGLVTNEELTIFVLASGTVGGAHHWWTTAYVAADGINVEGEYNSTHEFRHVGSYTHELGHDLGLPDLYDTDSGVTGPSEGIGNYGMMGGGSWTFTQFTAWSKMQLGWLTPTVVTTPGYYTVHDSETNPEAYILVDPGYSLKEYFLVENKFPSNSYYETVGAPVAPNGPLPDQGICIWHIDDEKMQDWITMGDNNVNVDETHKCVDVETAEHPSSHFIDADDLDANVNRGDAQDLWDINEYDFFDGSTPCDANWYSGDPSEMIVSDIPASSAAMTVVFNGFEPEADAGGPYNGVVGSSMIFDASGSFDFDGMIVSYEWDFDDNGTWDSSVTTPTTTYKYTATYNGQVRLRVTDDDGLFSEDVADVVIELPTTAAISPKTNVTLQKPGGTLFTVRDQDLAFVDVKVQELYPYFAGSQFGFSSLDAVDLVEPASPGDPLMIFSVRENKLLSSGNGQSIYAHKADIISMNKNTGQFNLLFKGSDYGVANVDAVSILEDDSIVFSAEAGFMYGTMWFNDEDLVRYDPVLKNLSLFLRGMDFGANTLDAVDILYERVYFSVSSPAYIGKFPYWLYMKPGDVGLYNMNTGELEFFMQGLPYGISGIDAMCLEGLVRHGGWLDMQVSGQNPGQGYDRTSPLPGSIIR